MIQVWNIATKTLEKQYPADNGKTCLPFRWGTGVLIAIIASCLDVAWIDDLRFVTCGGDRVIHVFQLNTTKPIRTLK